MKRSLLSQCLLSALVVGAAAQPVYAHSQDPQNRTCWLL